MSMRGEFYIVCDLCEGEVLFVPESRSVEPRSFGTEQQFFAVEWLYRDGQDICPQCLEDRDV